MKIQRKILLIFFILLSVFANAQQDTVKRISHKPKFFLSLIGYTSYIQGDVATFGGLRIGLSYQRKHRFGIGLAGMKSDVVRKIRIKTDSVDYNTNAYLRFGYFEMSYEYIFRKKFPWQFSISSELGIGTVFYEYVKTKDSAFARTPNHAVLIFQPELKAQYGIFRWIGIGSSLGYRFTLYAPDAVNENFNSIAFSLGLQLYLDEIYDMVFPRGICGKKKVEQ